MPLMAVEAEVVDGLWKTSRSLRPRPVAAVDSTLAAEFSSCCSLDWTADKFVDDWAAADGADRCESRWAGASMTTRLDAECWAVTGPPCELL